MPITNVASLPFVPLIVKEPALTLPVPETVEVWLVRVALANVVVVTGAATERSLLAPTVIPVSVNTPLPAIVDVPVLAVVNVVNDLETSMSKVPPALIMIAVFAVILLAATV